MANWKYGIVLKHIDDMTEREKALFDVVATSRNGRIDANGDIVYDLKYDHYVSVEALNWDSRHDKVVNDARDAFNATTVKEPVTERVITTVGQRRLLGK